MTMAVTCSHMTRSRQPLSIHQASHLRVLIVLQSTVVASLASDYKRWAVSRAAKPLPAASPSPQ